MSAIDWIKMHYKNNGAAGVVLQSFRVLRAYSAFMIIGAVIGLIWANSAHESYVMFKHITLFVTDWVGEHHEGHRVVSIHYLITDLAMALFFFIAGKEVWEAIVTENGSLRDLKKAAVPLIATVGGIVGPALVYVVMTMLTGHMEAVRGWAIPTATDIAFSYVVGRIIFGPDHTAIKFLLLLAIADDAGGLGILAIFYPQDALQLQWLALVAIAMAAGHYLLHKRWKIMNFWFYMIIVGIPSMVGFVMSGLHPVLGLLPVIPTMPHSETDLGLFMREEQNRHDTLNEAEHWFRPPVEIILFWFALLNSGVEVTNIGAMTIPVVVALLIGKPVGIFSFGWLAARKWGFPPGMNIRDLIVVGSIAGVGFTVALFVTTVALPSGPLQDAAKVGALLSLFSSVIAIGLAKVLHVGNGYSTSISPEPELAEE